jgi:Raf kinase inhibitor-like YbhB/YbcL family protein
MKLKVLLIGITIFLVGCIFLMIRTTNNDQPDLVVTSSSFNNGGTIPIDYTCDGKNISPQLGWVFKSPEKIESYVLVVDDPDAQQVAGKTFVHWIALFSKRTTSIPDGISGNLNSIDNHAIELTNSYGKTIYQGPCPPVGGGKHHYKFTLFATTVSVQKLSTELHAPCTAQECAKILAGNIVAQAVLVGVYGR